MNKQHVHPAEAMPTHILIQDEPVLTYQPPPVLNSDPLALLMSPSFGHGEKISALLLDAHRHSAFKSHTTDNTAQAAAESTRTNNTELSAVAETNADAQTRALQQHYAPNTLASHGGDLAQVRAAELALVRHAAMEPKLQHWSQSYPDHNIEDKIRAVAAAIIVEKGYFGVDTDEQSMLLYDIRFLLASHHHLIAGMADWLQDQASAETQGNCFYPNGNHAELAELWLLKRLADGDIIETISGLKPTPEFEQTIQQVLTAYTWA